MQKKDTLKLYSEISADISGALKSVDVLKEELAKVSFPKNATKKLDSSIEKIIERINEFEYAARQGVDSLEDVKSLQKSWKGVLELLNKAGIQLEGLQKLENIFPTSVVDNIEKATDAMKAYKKEWKNVTEKQDYKDAKELQKNADENYKKRLKELQNKRDAETEAMASRNQVYEEKNWDKRKKVYEHQLRIQNFFVEKIKKEKEIQEEILKNNLILNQSGNKKGTLGKKALEDWEKKKEAYKKIDKNSKEALQLEEELEKFKDAEEASKKYLVSLQNVQKAQDNLAQRKSMPIFQKLEEDSKIIKDIDEKYDDAVEATTKATDAFEGQKRALAEANLALQKFKDTAASQEWTDLEEALRGLGATDEDIENIKNDLTQIDGLISKYKTKNIEAATENFDKMEKALEGVAGAADNVEDATDSMNKEFEESKNAAAEMENLRRQLLDFFSISNTISLFKRAVNSALETVKQLDATMTEAAVVTEFDVSDMWAKMPEYTKQAQKLGVAINDMYQATTLYYQQGLKSNEAMALGVETMKMAKIAGMDSAESTKAMTSALRGFNMELNEASAQRINDVYSQLAAVTAADTSQIAAAMEKTASIASSANMEFETTAAFLSQIIETTQEAPETAGTALKTITARFSEVKKLRDEGLVTGLDEEGEEIDVNNIETALKTVGISMDNFFAGSEGLDKVLLRLAEKWSGLDFETQRYIATMAAGSRQQSRFIAMMSNYERTVELVGEAQNSTGASQRQFNKTLDSMESKLQKLEAAWQEFLMGLANDELLKGAIDFATDFLTTINKIIDSISGGNGLVKSITSLGAVIGALSMGKSLFGSVAIKTEEQKDGSVVKKLIRVPKKDSQKMGEEIGTGLIAGLKRSVNQRTTEKTLGGAFNAIQRKTVAMFHSGKVDPESEKYQQQMGQGESFIEKAISENINYTGLSSDEQDQLWSTFEDAVAMGASTKEAFKEVNKQLEKMGKYTVNVKKNFKDADLSIRSLEFDTKVISGLGKATGVAATAAGLLAMAFEAVGREQWAEEASKFASSLAIASAVMSVIPGTIKSIKTMIDTLGATGSWVTLVISALAALIAIGINLQKEADEKVDPSKQMEKTRKEIDALDSVASQAKSTLEELAEVQTKLEGFKSTFSSLTKGTEEWRQAIMDNNEQVLALIDANNSLGQYVTTGAFGELTISAEGFEELERIQQNVLLTSTNASIAASQNLAELQIKYAWEDFFDGKDGASPWNSEIVKDYGTEGRVVKVNDIDPYIDTFGALAERGIDFNTNDADTLYKIWEENKDIIGVQKEAFKVMTSQLYSTDEAIKFGQDAMTAKAQERVRVQAITENVKSKALNTNQVKQTEALDVAAEAMAGLYDDYDSRLDEKKNSYALDLAGNNRNSAIEKYAQYSGKAIDSINEAIKAGTMTDEQIASELAAKDIDKEMVDVLKVLSQSVSKLDKTQQGIFKNNGLGISVSTLKSNKTKNLNAEDYAKQIAAQMGVTAENARIVTGMEFDAFIHSLSVSYKNAEGAYDKALEKATNYGVKKSIDAVLRTWSGVTAMETQEMANALADIKVSGGDVQAFANLIPRLLGGLSGEDRRTAEALITNTTWTSRNSIDSTIAALKNMGVAIDESLIDQIYEATNAVMDFSLEKLNQELTSLNELAKMVAEKMNASNRSYTGEEKDKLIAEGFGENEFVRIDIDEYAFMGETNDLLGEINDKMSELLSEYGTTIEEEIQTGEQWKDYLEGDNKVHYGGQGWERELTLSAKEAMSRVIEGKASDTMTRELAKNLGIESADTLSIEALTKALTDGYTRYYEKLSQNLELALKQQREYDTMEYAKIAGTQEFIDTTTKAQAKKANIERFSKKSQDELARIASGEVLPDDTARKLGILFGLDADSLSKSELLKKLAAYWNEAYLPDLSQDARISSTKGLAFTKEDFGVQALGSKTEISKYETLLKTLAIGSYEAGKAADALNQILSEQGEAFKTDDGLAYYAALEDIVRASKEIFGETADREFVETNKDLFIQLLSGGKEAQVAYEELGARAAHDYVVGLGKNISFETIQGELGNILGRVEVGDAIDLTTLANQLAENLGIALEEALNLLDLGGFTVNTQNGKVLGAREDAAGTGAVTLNGAGDLENPYDIYYNELKLINEELRKREKLEREYQDLLDSKETSGGAILKNLQAQLTTLDEEEKYWTQILTGIKGDGTEDSYGGRLGELKKVWKENSDLKKYAKWDETSNTPQIDWAEIDKINNEELLSEVTGFVSELERILDDQDEAEDELVRIAKERKERENQGQDEYTKMLDRVRDAIIDAEQREIDELQAINDTLYETNSKIINSMQDLVNERRQIRENEKSEQELANMRNQLAYLESDSGANPLDILELREQIAEAEQSYTDTLIDQKISELQKQNDEAREQRQKQIDIARLQLESYTESKKLWEDVQQYIINSTKAEGVLIDSALTDSLKKSEGWETMSFAEREAWMEELQNNLAVVYAYMASHKLLGSSLPAYASGGVADFTGPAWLDGTKTNPEYILNAKQTRAFFDLVDVLGSFDKTSARSYNGENNYDIDINIENMNEEADVDMLIEKLTNMITSSARYRNNNAF